MMLTNLKLCDSEEFTLNSFVSTVWGFLLKKNAYLNWLRNGHRTHFNTRQRAENKKEKEEVKLCYVWGKIKNFQST